MSDTFDYEPSPDSDNRDDYDIPVCPYCGERAVLRDTKAIYGKSYGMAWVCKNYPVCDSYVGCHKGTRKPLGRMEDQKLRSAKRAAHNLFDPLWQGGRYTRKQAYEFLAKKLNISIEECHIGMFDVEMCNKAVTIMQKRWWNGR